MSYQGKWGMEKTSLIGVPVLFSQKCLFVLNVDFNIFKYILKQSVPDVWTQQVMQLLLE